MSGSVASVPFDLGPRPLIPCAQPRSPTAEVAERRSGLVAGTFDVFDGPLKKQDATLWIDDGAKMTDAQMLSMMEFVEGVVGEVPAE